MKYLTSKKSDLEKLKADNFYKLVWIDEEEDDSTIVIQCTKEYNRKINKLEFITIMVSENNSISNTEIGEKREWSSYRDDISYFIDLQDELEDLKTIENETI